MRKKRDRKVREERDKGTKVKVESISVKDK